MKVIKKLASAAGESIAEALIAVLILALGFVIAAGASEAAARVNERIKNEAVALDLTEPKLVDDTTKIEITLSGNDPSLSTQADETVKLYKTKDDRYYYYDTDSTETEPADDETEPEGT